MLQQAFERRIEAHSLLSILRSPNFNIELAVNFSEELLQ